MKAIARLKDDARRYELSEEWERAIDAYLQVLQLAEQGDGSEADLPLYNRVGDLYVRLGRPMDAVTYYEQAADRYAEAGLFNNAIALCNKALRYDARRLPLLRKLGSFSASQGFFTDARRWYLEFAEKSIQRGVVDDAFSALADLASATDDVEIRELLGRQLRDHGRHAEAVEELKRAHAWRSAAGQYAEADSLCAELLQLDPNVDLTSTDAPAPAYQVHEWQQTEQLPGFADFDQDGAVTEADVDVVEETVTASFDSDDIAHPDDAADWSNVAAPEPDETMLDVLDDAGTFDVEVEEHHALLDLNDFSFDSEMEDAEAAAPLPGFDDLVDSYDGDFELPIVELVDADETGSEVGEDTDAVLPGFEPEAHAFTRYDDSEFGAYAGEAEDETGPAATYELEYQREAITNPEVVDESELAASPLIEDEFEFEVAVSHQLEQDSEATETADLEYELPAHEGPELYGIVPAAELEVEYEVEPAAGDDEVHDLDSQPVLEAAADDRSDSGVVTPITSELQTDDLAEYETEGLEALEWRAADSANPEAELQALEDTDALPEDARVEAPVPPLPSSATPRWEYVDLASLIDENDEEEAAASTRFVVAEMPPTGDEEKDFADMLQQFKQKVAASIPKEDAGSHYDLGIAFKEMGLIDEAIGEFQTALRSGQEKLKVYEELGTCFMLKKQFSVAVTVLSRAQHMPFTDETEMLGVYYNLGRAHEELGQHAEARAAFEKIVAVDIGFQDTTQRLARL